MSATCAVLVLGAFGLAQAVAEGVEILPRWKKGEKAAYKLVKSRERARDDKATQEGKSTTDIKIEVIQADNHGFVMSWTFGEPKLEGPGGVAQHPLIKRMVQLVTGTKFLLEVDKSGSLKGVKNWEEIKKLTSQALEMMMKESLPEGLDKDKAGAFRSMVESMLATKEQIEQLCTREAELFFLPFGKKLASGQPLDYEVNLPNPFGGEPLPGRGRFDLKTYDKSSGQAVITRTQTISPEAMKRFLEDLVKKATEQLGQPPATATMPKTITIEDSSEIVINVPSGWIESVTLTRTTKVDGAVQIERQELRRTALP